MGRWGGGEMGRWGDLARLPIAYYLLPITSYLLPFASCLLPFASCLFPEKPLQAFDFFGFFREFSLFLTPGTGEDVQQTDGSAENID